MSEYQRYEFMTVNRPLTKKEQEAVDALSSHIEVSSTPALVEYNWGDFKSDYSPTTSQYPEFRSLNWVGRCNYC